MSGANAAFASELMVSGNGGCGGVSPHCEATAEPPHSMPAIKHAAILANECLVMIVLTHRTDT